MVRNLSMSEESPKTKEISTQIKNFAKNDFTTKDLEAIEKFKEDGMLGLATISDTDIHRMMSLYLDGKGYREIARITKKDRILIMFLSQKMEWQETRQQYIEELSHTLKDQLLESKLRSQDFFLHLIHAYQKKIGRNVDAYLRTDDEKFSDKIDVKDINTLLKITELLHKLNNENLSPNDKSLVALNGMGEGMTITKTGTNSIEIMPKGSYPIANKLKQFADLKRGQEKTLQSVPKKTHDITVEQVTIEPEKESEDDNE